MIPTLTIYDSSGSAIASNDNWQDNINRHSRPEEWTRAARSVGIGTRASPARGKLIPPSCAELNDGTGIGLAEVYTLH